MMRVEARAETLHGRRRLCLLEAVGAGRCTGHTSYSSLACDLYFSVHTIQLIRSCAALYSAQHVSSCSPLRNFSPYAVTTLLAPSAVGMDGAESEEAAIPAGDEEEERGCERGSLGDVDAVDAPLPAPLPPCSASSLPASPLCAVGCVAELSVASCCSCCCVCCMACSCCCTSVV